MTFDPISHYLRETVVCVLKSYVTQKSNQLNKMSLQFTNPASFVLSGPSGVGKTFFIFRFIDHIHQICPEIKKVLYHYEVWQDIFEKYEDKVSFSKGLPNLEALENAKDSLLILDDFMTDNLKFIAKIYSVYSHHYRFSVITTIQNLFNPGVREISLNSKFIVIFKSVRDQCQINYFLRQIYPKQSGEALKVYKDATSTARGYLLIDLRCDTDQNERLRTCIFPGETNFVYTL